MNHSVHISKILLIFENSNVRSLFFRLKILKILEVTILILNSHYFLSGYILLHSDFHELKSRILEILKSFRNLRYNLLANYNLLIPCRFLRIKIFV